MTKATSHHTTTCYGTCPKIDLEIDSNRNIYLSGEFYKAYGLIDTAMSGKFVGKLTDTLYNELINILKTSNLRSLYFPEAEGMDGSTKTLIIYYNGQRKYLKSMFPPTIAERLILFLYRIRKIAVMTRTNEKRTIEE